jgi:hypothetical protein
MRASLLKNLRHPENESRRSRINYKIVTFTTCLVIACFLWLMNSLARKYTENLNFVVQLQNLPQDKKLSPSSGILSVKLTTTGFTILTYKWGLKEPNINMDFSQFRHKDNRYQYIMNTKTHIEKIEEQFGEDVKVVDIAPDTLFLNTTQN